MWPVTLTHTHKRLCYYVRRRSRFFPVELLTVSQWLSQQGAIRKGEKIYVYRRKKVQQSLGATNFKIVGIAGLQSFVKERKEKIRDTDVARTF